MWSPHARHNKIICFDGIYTTTGLIVSFQFKLFIGVKIIRWVITIEIQQAKLSDKSNYQKNDNRLAEEQKQLVLCSYSTLCLSAFRFVLSIITEFAT